jgi:hypothetical protein
MLKDKIDKKKKPNLFFEKNPRELEFTNKTFEASYVLH